MLFIARRILFISILLCLTFSAQAQEMWGAANSNYAGNMGLELNPASIVGAPYTFEIHLLSADISAMNNYLYLMKHSKAIRSAISGTAIPPERLTYENTERDKFGNVQAFVKAPGFIFSKEKWGLGFHASTRLALSARGVPYHLANFMKEGFDFKPQQKIDYAGGNAKIAAMNWHEIGLSGAMVLKNSGMDYFTGGLTLNYLYGLNSFYLLVNDINYNVQSDSLWQIYLAKVEYGHASIDINNPNSAGAFTKKGSGFSGNLGFQYYHNRSAEAYAPCQKSKLKKYDYKIGFSLIDFGKIKYSNSAAKFVFNNVSTDWYGIDTVKIKGIAKTDVTFNNQFFGSPNAGQTASSYSIWLPAAASVQVDYAFTPDLYLNLSVIQRIPINEYTIRRANQIAVTLRYERKHFEIDIPYSFYDYFRHRIGLAIRMGIFTLGTDMIGPFTGISNTYGMDVYFGIKWQYFKKCKSRGIHQRKGNYEMDCFKELKN